MELLAVARLTEAAARGGGSGDYVEATRGERSMISTIALFWNISMAMRR